MAFANIWDDNFPPDTEAANLIGSNLRQLRVDTQQRMAAISGLDAAKPAYGADAQPLAWTGILYFATDTGIIYQWSGAAWVNITSSILSGGVQQVYTQAVGTNPVAIPGNTLQVGSWIRAIANYSINGGTAGTSQAYVQLNNVGLLGSITQAAHANASGLIILDFLCLTAGVGGVVAGNALNTNNNTQSSANFTPDTTGIISINGVIVNTGTGAGGFGPLKVVVII